MSSEPSVKTEVCGAFQPQAWRKTLCVNCFHTLDEHGGTGETPAATTDSKTTKPTENKSSPKTPSKIQPKTPESPSTPKTGTKSPLAQSTTGKSSPLSNVKNGDKPVVKTATQDVSKTTKVDAKKQPPSVAAKHPPEPPGRKTTPSHTQQTTPPDGGKSATVSKVANFGKVATGVGDPLRKQNGADVKTKTTPGIGKSDTNITTSGKVSPVLSNKSQKSAPDDHKSSSKQPFTAPVDKKPGLSLDKSTKPSRVEDKQKQPEDETKSKPSKIFGLMKSFGSTDDTSSDVRGTVKDKARSEKNETKPETDVSKFHLKDSQISPKGSSSEQKQSSNSIKPSAITSNTPPLARANVLTDTSKGKQAEVTSRGKQGLGDGTKDRQERSSNHLDSVSSRGGKDTAQTLDSSKGKTFAPSSLISASKGKDSNVSTKDTISSKHSDSSSKSSEVSSHKTDELLKSKELELAKLTTKLKEMEEKCRKLTEDNAALKKMAYDSKKLDVEKSLSTCKSQLATMEAKCAKLQGDNQDLQNKMKMKDVQSNKDKPDSKAVSQLERDLETSDAECQELKSENLELRKELSNLKVEMEEMYDTFKENEMDEFRELQKELDLASKNCRILQFKLRKSERRNEQIEADKHGYEDKLRSLQSQFTSDDARDHIRALEEDLKMAKEVSVRLNDEIDMLEDKKCKVEDENRQLTEILEQADKKQFRMEMDIDRLKDQIADLKQKVPRSQTEQDTRDRRTY
ncbi:proteoglycan 4 [Patella vulgata]|uniref:proteoglycan 4 n=1 Tax=Patella vulgata TaxID=6465 RepID=UPI00217FE3DA|nr:proteoglycan 4 [Patella vulgata]